MSDAAKRAINNRQKRLAKKKRQKLVRRISLIGIAAAVLVGLTAVILIFVIPKFTDNQANEPTVPAQPSTPKRRKHE